MALTKRIRFEILKRDNHTCRYCGASAPDVTLHVDHVTPQALGGTDDPTNLVTACVDCNLGKASTSPDAETIQDVAREALRWSLYVRQAEGFIEAREQELFDYRDAFTEAWESWEYGASRKPLPLPDDWKQSIETFRKSGLSATALAQCVKTAGNSGVPAARIFKYFCGVAWSRIREARELAKEYLLADEAALIQSYNGE
jgi:hypothetical protein